ncbi:MAG: methionine adenosyltransferase [Bacillota bacterium]
MLITSESVTEGHPDKLCDRISDAVLDEFLKQDPYSRVAVETVVSSGVVFITGEISSKSIVDIANVARRVIRDTGYTDEAVGMDAKKCTVITNMNVQSSDIAMGVDRAYELKNGFPEKNGEDELLGAGDQGMMYGYACRETASFMPVPIDLAHKLAERLDLVRKTGRLHYLRPDGKTQVTVEYDKDNNPIAVNTVVVSAQHSPDIGCDELREGIVREVILPVIPAHLMHDNLKLYINPTGRFVTGGPKADSGLTGRKIIVDTYGGFSRHGGGAFSGKDPTKVDRSGAYMARYAAKNIVAAGLADRCEIAVAYAIGVAHPVSIHVDTYGSEKTDRESIARLIEKHFDFRPGAIISHLRLRRPIYGKTAAYGHFGRQDEDFSWEAVDKAAILKSEIFK